MTTICGETPSHTVQPGSMQQTASCYRWGGLKVGVPCPGILGVDFPDGFVLDDPCIVRDLGSAYYAIYSPPEASGRHWDCRREAH
eukprot:4743885-Amphidinium_carterae.1